MNESTFNLYEILYIIKKHLKLILLITTFVILVSSILNFFIIKPKFESSTKLFIGKDENSDNQIFYDNNDVMMYQKLMKTYSELLKSSDLISSALNTNDRNQINETLNNLSVNISEDSQILTIVFKGNNPQTVLDTTNSITNEFIKDSNRLIPNSNIQIIQKAQIPINPISPKKFQNVFLSIILGIFISSLCIILIEYFDDTFKSRENLEKTTLIPIIGSIPNSNEEDC